jgi:hypothetical protein
MSKGTVTIFIACTLTIPPDPSKSNSPSLPSSHVALLGSNIFMNTLFLNMQGKNSDHTANATLQTLHYKIQLLYTHKIQFHYGQNQD